VSRTPGKVAPPAATSIRLRASRDHLNPALASVLHPAKKGKQVRVQKQTGTVTWAIADEDFEPHEIVKLDVRPTSKAVTAMSVSQVIDEVLG
jgi:hypothetical protein